MNLPIDLAALIPAGIWLWDHYADSVVTWIGVRMGGKVSEAARAGWRKVDWNNASTRYRAEIMRQCGTMSILGMASPVALEDIYTDVFILDKPTAWRRHNIADLAKQGHLDSDEQQLMEKRQKGLDVVAANSQLYVLGKPGAGKTTFLKYIVLEAVKGNLDYIPIFISLKLWSDSGRPLMEYIAWQFEICAFPHAVPFVEYILSAGKGIVLFDGLDEVNMEEGLRGRIVSQVRDFANQYPLSHFVITCRTAASEYQFERFVYSELADFNETQMHIFVSKWFGRGTPKCDTFLAEFEKPEHTGLRDLARTPLLLTLLCIGFDELMTFPPRRTDIYEEALDALLKKWDSSRNIRRDSIYRKLSLSHKRQLLARIAVETFGSGDLFMRQEELERRIHDYLRPLPSSDKDEEIDTEAILKAIEAQHGILVERAYRIYSFSHLTFHEYFTSRYVLEHPSARMFQSIVSHANDTRWREVLLLTASMLDETNAISFFTVFEKEARAKVGTDSVVTELFTWMNRKSEKVNVSSRFYTAMSYLYWAIVEKFVHDTTSVFAYTTMLSQTYSDACTLLNNLDEQPTDENQHLFSSTQALASTLLSADSEHHISGENVLLDIDSFINHRTLVEPIIQESALALLLQKVQSAAATANFLASDNKLETLPSQAQDLVHKLARDVGLVVDIIKKGITVLNNRTAYIAAFISIQQLIGLDVGFDRQTADPWSSTNSEYLWHKLLMRIRAYSQATSITEKPSQYYHLILKHWAPAVQEVIANESNLDILRTYLSKTSLPQEEASKQEWLEFEKQLRELLVANYDIGQIWSISTGQIESLTTYFKFCSCLLECLDLAAVAERDALRNRLLAPT